MKTPQTNSYNLNKLIFPLKKTQNQLRKHKIKPKKISNFTYFFSNIIIQKHLDSTPGETL